MKLCLALLVPALLTACATPYMPKPGEKTARINIRETGHLTICHDGKKYSAWAETGSNYSVVPANVPVSIFVTKTVGGSSNGSYSVTYTCSPRTGINVEPGKSYFLNFEMFETKCRLELYEETELSPVHLRPILPIAPQTCS